MPYDKKEDRNQYIKKITDFDEIEGTDIKINPDYYIHTALLKAQEALANSDITEGFLKYRIFIEHIETLCKSSKMLSKEYYGELKTYTETDDYKKEEDTRIQSIKLVNKKLELLMAEVFQSKAIFDSLQL